MPIKTVLDIPKKLSMLDECIINGAAAILFKEPFGKVVV